MYRLLSFILLSLPIVSVCQRTANNGSYINHEKWRTYDDFESMRDEKFYGKPVMIKETSYIHLKDSAINTTGKFAGYRVLQYDAAGDLRLKITYVDSNRIDTMKVWYDRNGRHQTYIDYWYPDITKVFHKAEWYSQRLAPGKFGVTFSSNGQKRSGHTITFLSNGNTIQREESDGDKTRNSYQDSRLIETESIGKSSFYKVKYFYSDKGVLDSIHISATNYPPRRIIFQNNAQGDPVYIQKFSDDKILMIQRRWYEYDSKGNWVKQLNYYESSERPGIYWYDRFYKRVDYNRFYTLVVREIRYK